MVESFDVWRQSRHILKRITFHVDAGQLLAIIGPLGAGKTTLLRCMNRLFENNKDVRFQGNIRLSGENIYDKNVDLAALRKSIGLVFSEPTVFSSATIFENVAIGLRLAQETSGAQVGEAVEKALREVQMWETVKGKLKSSPEVLSAGERQKLCVARALVLEPRILLMDEPTFTLGLQEMTQFEQMLRDLRKKVTVIFTTSHRKQAARVSDKTAFLLDGELIEIGKTSDMFMNPKETRTEDYLTGRFG